MIKRFYLDSCKVMLATLAGTAIFSAPLSLQAAVSQQPLSLTEGVAPNLLVTLDDSGSMAWSYTPDAISGQSARRAARSPSYNASYYNPENTYQIPKKVRMEGGQIVVEDWPTPSFTAAVRDGFATGDTPVDLSRHFRPTWNNNNFLTTCPSGITCDSDGRARAHYFRYNPSATCTLPAVNTDSCYSLVSLPTAQEQNFANWYTYYRNRNLATRSAASLAFYSLPDNVRLTWGRLNGCTIGSNAAGNCMNNTIARFAGQHRANFFSWLSTLPASGGTPLHNAMKAAGNFLVNNANAYTDETGNQFACRASYHILMTDGMWNGQPSGSTNHDGALPYPYRDGQANTLADWAYYYWSTDLRPNLANEVKPFIPYKYTDSARENADPRNNPATWQHMVNFTVGLGLSNSLTNSTAPTWTGTTFGNWAELSDPDFSSKRWPTVGNDRADNVYDLWHAALNSRGEFFSADSPQSLVDAFASVLSRISDRNTSAAAPAISSGLQDDGSGDPTSFSYQTSYASDESWAGDLKAFRTIRRFNSVTGTFETTTEQQWSARQQLQNRDYTTRNINIAGTGTTGLQPLTWANAGNAGTVGTLAYWLRQNPDNGDTLESTSNTLASNRLLFLRGDRGGEGNNFRTRSTVLGDMIYSKPVTVRGARYLVSYANRIENNTAYSNFFQAQRDRVPHVYVGANDGMLHAFNALTGVETFAFVPTAVFPKLHKLTGKNYEGSFHQFYVDGSPTVADVYINNSWRTILVGTLRAGGKGLFALDITDPAAIRLLWQFDDSRIPTNNAVRLGYSFSQPTIARLHNGKWAVVVGNGYESTNHTNGRAALLIIDAATGNLTKSLEVQGATGVANGLSTPKLADMNVDGVADYAYAGDLQGNLWRFNLAPTATIPFARQTTESTAAENSFRVSYNGNPLFRAMSANGRRQPITSAPTIIRHPSLTGHIITFGTGKYFEEGDKNGAVDMNQSIYGIWDTQTKSTSGTETVQPAAGITRAKLQRQEMNTTIEPATGGEARVLTQNTVLWAQPPVAPATTWTDSASHKYGWYFDFALPREMMIENINTLGQTLFFQTLVPNSDPCASGAVNWSYAINPYTGGRTRHHAFTNVRSTAIGDPVVSAVRQDGEGGTTIGQDPGGDFKLCTGLSCEIVEPDPSSVGRQTWRVIGEQQ